MKILQLIKKRFWFSFFLTISITLLASLLGASTLWSVVSGLVGANLVNLIIFLKTPVQRNEKHGLPDTEKGIW